MYIHTAEHELIRMTDLCDCEPLSHRTALARSRWVLKMDGEEGIADVGYITNEGPSIRPAPTTTAQYWPPIDNY